MKVVLRSDLDRVGKRGDLLEVADGYARNYLIPHGLAIPATEGIEAQAAAMRRARDLKDAKDREGAEAVARKLVPMVITIPARAGAEGRLFGSVTTSDVVEAVHEQAGIELDRRRILSSEAIKSVGTHEIGVRLHPEVQFQITVEVVPA
ncbi:MAG TPA: 50S ribosomal protein L9 [Acidimicrobiales bacterium]|nr:50S ribosomal protein L9 [Acidimicrobiales bacterium]